MRFNANIFFAFNSKGRPPIKKATLSPFWSPEIFQHNLLVSLRLLSFGLTSLFDSPSNWHQMDERVGWVAYYANVFLAYESNIEWQRRIFLGSIVKAGLWGRRTSLWWLFTCVFVNLYFCICVWGAGLSFGRRTSPCWLPQCWSVTHIKSLTNQPCELKEF